MNTHTCCKVCIYLDDGHVQTVSSPALLRCEPRTPLKPSSQWAIRRSGSGDRLLYEMGGLMGLMGGLMV